MSDPGFERHAPAAECPGTGQGANQSAWSSPPPNLAQRQPGGQPRNPYIQDPYQPVPAPRGSRRRPVGTIVAIAIIFGIVALMVPLGFLFFVLQGLMS